MSRLDVQDEKSIRSTCDDAHDESIHRRDHVVVCMLTTQHQMQTYILEESDVGVEEEGTDYESVDGESVGSVDTDISYEEEGDLEGFVVPDDAPMRYDSPVKRKKMDTPDAPKKRRRLFLIQDDSSDEEE